MPPLLASIMTAIPFGLYAFGYIVILLLGADIVTGVVSTRQKYKSE